MANAHTLFIYPMVLLILSTGVAAWLGYLMSGLEHFVTEEFSDTGRDLSRSDLIFDSQSLAFDLTYLPACWDCFGVWLLWVVIAVRLIGRLGLGSPSLVVFLGSGDHIDGFV